MYSKNANKTKMEMLQDEYLAIHEDITKKQCYCKGLMEEIGNTIEDFYRGYKGKFYRMCLDENGNTVNEARISSIEIRGDYDMIDIEIRLAGCPITRTKANLTKKEQELISKAQKIWDENKKHSWFDAAKDYEKIGMELYMLKNSIRIFDVVYLCVCEDSIYAGENPCNDYLNISNLRGMTVYLKDYYLKSIY